MSRKVNQPVEVGQVYREKDSRFIRYVRIYAPDINHHQPAFWCWPCDAKGVSVKDPEKGKNDRRTTLISLKNLQKRFELITPEKP